MGKLQVVVGGQFGSEGKGAVCAWLAQQERRDLMAIRVGGPNAGHTVYDDQGQRWPLRHVPVAAVVRPDAQLGIAAGSEVDLDVLSDEIRQLRAEGYPVPIMVDEQATIIEREHRLEEVSLTSRIGSTGKGIGAARAARIMRRARIVEDNINISRDVTKKAAAFIRDGGTVQIEGAQGFGLGLHAGYYPKCTSSDCRAIDALSMAGLSPWAPYVTEFEVWVVLRTYPIRVAGDSGPLFAETSWDILGERTHGYIQPEKTTVTQKIRRVGEWDRQLARQAILANGGPPVHVALTMVDYLWPDIYGFTSLHRSFWDEIDTYVGHLPAMVRLAGTGPKTIAERPR